MRSKSGDTWKNKLSKVCESVLSAACLRRHRPKIIKSENTCMALTVLDNTRGGTDVSLNIDTPPECHPRPTGAGWDEPKAPSKNICKMLSGAVDGRPKAPCADGESCTLATTHDRVVELESRARHKSIERENPPRTSTRGSSG